MATEELEIGDNASAVTRRKFCADALAASVISALAPSVYAKKQAGADSSAIRA